MLILASASPRRRDLLAQIYVTPSSIHVSDVDETPLKAELPRDYALRIALAKAHAAPDNHPVLAADTVVAVGRRILGKAETEDDVRHCLTLLSGRSHRVYTAVVVKNNAQTRHRLVETRVTFKRLSLEDINAYLASGEGLGKAGGYAIQGLAASYITKISGSYSNVVGLPLFETAQLLKSI
jgi:septum formation protein